MFSKTLNRMSTRTHYLIAGLACTLLTATAYAQSDTSEDATSRLERLLEEYEFTTPSNYESPGREASPGRIERDTTFPRTTDWEPNFEARQDAETEPEQLDFVNPFGDGRTSFDEAVRQAPRKMPIINEEGEILMPVDRQDIISERNRPQAERQPLPERARGVKPLPKVKISKGIKRAELQLLNRISLNNEQMTLRTKSQEIGEFDMLELEVLGCVIEPSTGTDRAMALVNIRERVPNLRFTPDGKSQKSERVETIYAGWLISDVPYVSGPNHAIYDVTLKGCS